MSTRAEQHSWFQGKRVPLYFVVGGSLLTAALYFRSRGSHPHVEVDKSLRQNPVAEERHTALDEGHNYRDSIGRKISKPLLHEDSDSKSSRPHGILPNNRVKPED